MSKQNFFVIAMICLIITFLFAKYCWSEFLGFNTCESVLDVSAYNVIIDENNEIIDISGKTATGNSGFSGYVYEVKGNKLFVGIRKNIINGFFDRKSYFDLKIACDAKRIDEIVFFDGKKERLVWKRHGLLNKNVKSRIIRKN